MLALPAANQLKWINTASIDANCPPQTIPQTAKNIYLWDFKDSYQIISKIIKWGKKITVGNHGHQPTRSNHPMVMVNHLIDRIGAWE